LFTSECANLSRKVLLLDTSILGSDPSMFLHIVSEEPINYELLPADWPKFNIVTMLVNIKLLMG